jgi:pimeloyl-ACP methyl ester carboxylesterase
MQSIAVYLIPGLGADHRVFEFIDLKGFDVTIIRWEHPHKNEPIADYVKRLLPQVKHAMPVFIGLSFGGVIGAELTKHFPDSKLILISSIASHAEIPWWGKFGAALGLNKIVPGTFMKRPNIFIRWFFTVHPGRDRKLFDEILRTSDPDFLYWAVNAILNWKGNASHRLHHIHGRKDRLLPARFTSADMFIEDGGHFMIVTNGEQVSSALIGMLKAIG